MKKFFVLTAILAAMFLMLSCGGDNGSDDNGNDGEKVCATLYGNGWCKGHDLIQCQEKGKIWQEVEGTGKKSTVCDENDEDCIKNNIVTEILKYCSDDEENSDETDSTDGGDSNGNGDSEGEDFVCSDVMQCSDDTMMQQCINSAASKCYYETHSKKYDFDCYDAQSKNDAMQKGMAECAG